MTRSPLARVDRRFHASSHGNEWSPVRREYRRKTSGGFSGTLFIFILRKNMNAKEGNQQVTMESAVYLCINPTRASQQP
jgi:hypothetical protein